MTGLDSLGTLPGILNYSEILKYSIELEIQESINSLCFCIQYSLLHYFDEKEKLQPKGYSLFWWR